ncbi:MAG TPA: alpha/beta hydrolase [Polyangiales bacterium]|nr:alpha/beta hydrolase [Polyangiales bacterium]
MFRTVLIAASLLVTAPALAEGRHHQCGRIDVNGIQTYYEVSGKGEPLLVLHGAHMNIQTMGEIIPVLAKTHKVYAFEFQGHGRSADIDRPITNENLADDAAVFMDAMKLERADVFGYSMGAAAALQLAIRHPEKVDQLITASVAYDTSGFQPAYLQMIPTMTPDMFASFEEDWRKLAPNPEGFADFIDKMIALEHETMSWEEDVKQIKAPVLMITGDSDVVTLEHAAAMFRLLGGGVMGDMGVPLAASRFAVLPATSHTAVITQVSLLHAFIEPFLQGVTPKGMFEQQQP